MILYRYPNNGCSTDKIHRNILIKVRVNPFQWPLKFNKHKVYLTVVNAILTVVGKSNRLGDDCRLWSDTL